MSRGFTSLTGKISRQKQLDAEPDDELEHLRKENTLIRNISNSYKNKYIKVLNELEEFKKSNQILCQLKEKYRFLYKHLLSLNLAKDDETAKHGNRFDSDLIPFYILTSTAGEYIVDLLHKYFAFPCYKTCSNFKNKFKDKYGITDDIFDGSMKSIRKSTRFLWKNDDKRCVVAVDVASVKAKMVLHKDGTVEGLMQDIKIEAQMYELITTNLDAYYSFFEQYRDKIVKYYFVFYVCSLNEENKSFPICLMKKTNGSANSDITQLLEEVAINCIHSGLDVVGLSFDGDPSYLKYVDEMCYQIIKLEKLDLKKPLSSIFDQYKGLLIFEDPLHLVKCCRYRLICGSRICPSLSDDNKTFSVEDFSSIGIKDYLLDNSKAKKMDDGLPILFFSKENIERALSAERFDILLAMLPSFLLINAIFSDQLTRSQRIEQLTFGCSLVLIYYNEYVRYDFDTGLQRRNKDKGNNPHMTLHDLIWARKYISLTISVANVLSDQRSIHLGSCGSHFLEHFFGMVRRFCGGNDSADAFQNAVTNIVIYKILQKKNLQDLNIQPGRSDSGSRLDGCFFETRNRSNKKSRKFI